MKIAVLLTGQLRTFDMVKYLHMNTLISKYDCDVFMSINLDNILQCENKNSHEKTINEKIENALYFFKPVDYIILDNFNDEIERIKRTMNFWDDSYKLLFIQYYVVKNAYNLLINHINKSGVQYDIIIRLRFDQFIFTDGMSFGEIYDNKLETILYNESNIRLLDELTKDKKIFFEEVLDNTIYLLGFGDFFHYKYANDQFFYHNSTILNYIFNFYDRISDLIEYCNNNEIGNKGALIECIFHLYLTNNNIYIKKSNISGIFIREFIQ